MSRDLPSLNAVRMFEAAARHQNFTRAAEQLCVTQGAVSRQIKQLEQDLNHELFVRDGPKLKLTDAGERFYLAVEQGLAAIRRGTYALRRQGARPTLTINVFPSLAAKWLISRIVQFQRSHGDVELRLTASYESVEFSQRPDIDAAIQFGTGDWDGVYSECIINEQLFPVCSPGFLQQNPALKTEADLSVAPLILADADDDQWADWFETANVVVPLELRGPRYSDALLLQQAAIEGQGVALARSLLVSDELAAGRLVRLFSTAIRSRNSFYFVCSTGNETSPLIRDFLVWLRSEALQSDDACENLLRIAMPKAS